MKKIFYLGSLLFCINIATAQTTTPDQTSKRPTERGIETHDGDEKNGVRTKKTEPAADSARAANEARRKRKADEKAMRKGDTTSIKP